MTVELSGSGAVWEIQLDHPDTRNALSNQVLGAIVDGLKEIEEKEEARCILLSGSDKVFASGADLAELAGQDAVEGFLGSRGALWRATRETRLPIVAAVSGHCLGGGFELAMAADLVIADPSATFGLPETSLGLVPGAGGGRALSFSAGPKVAADVVLSGRRLDAEEGVALGVVSRISEPGKARELAHAIAEEIATRPRAALILAKRALIEARESVDGLASDRAAFHLAVSSTEVQERISDFLDRRREAR